MDRAYLSVIGLPVLADCTAHFRKQSCPAVSPGQEAASKNVEAPGQLRLIVSGLMGSGKSTLCRTLAELLGGVWINQDECNGSKRAFLDEVGLVAKDEGTRVMLIDKINTMRTHRKGILGAIRKGGSHSRTVLLRMQHPLDAPGCLDHAVELCEARIRGRGAGHRTLFGNNPELQDILRRTAKGAQELQETELSSLRLVLSVDMTLPPAVAVTNVLADLKGNGMLPDLNVDELSSEAKLAEAVLLAQRYETSLQSRDGDQDEEGEA